MSALENLFGNTPAEENGSTSENGDDSDWNDAAREEIAALFEGDEEAAPESAPDLQSLRQSLMEEEAGEEALNDETEEELDEQLASLYEADETDGEEEEVDFDALRRAMASTTDDDEADSTDEDASQRLNWLVNFVVEDDVQRSSGDGAAEELSEPEEVDPSDEKVNRQALTDMAGIFRDKVLMSLLQQDIIDVSQAVRAVRQKNKYPDRPLWDVLANLPDVDSQQVFAEAACSQGIPDADLELGQPPDAFLKALVAAIPPPVFKQFAFLGLLPYNYEASAEEDQYQLLVASHYPTHPYVKEFVDGLSFGLKLHYAPESLIGDRIEEMQQIERSAEEQDEDESGSVEERLWSRLESLTLSQEDAAEPEEKASSEEDVAPEGVSNEESGLPTATDVLLRNGRSVEDLDLRPAAPIKVSSDRVDSPSDLKVAPAPHDNDQQSVGDTATLAEEEGENTETSGETSDEVINQEERSEEVSPAAAADVLFENDRAVEKADLRPVTRDEVNFDHVATPDELEVAPAPDQDREQPFGQIETPAENDVQTDAPTDEERTDEGENALAEAVDPPDANEEEDAGSLLDNVLGSLSDEEESEKEETTLPAQQEGEPKGLAAEMKRQEEARQEQNEEKADYDTAREAGAEEEPGADAFSEEETDEVIEEIKAEDRVTAMLLRKGIVSREEALQAKKKKEQTRSSETLWRIMAALNETNRESIYAEAATLYAFQTADLDEHAPDADFSRSVFERFDEEHQEQLLEMKVVPYKATEDERTGTQRMVFISHDPTRRNAHRLLHELSVDRFDLLYAPEDTVGELIAEAFPKKNEYLQRMEEDEESLAMDLGMAHEENDSLIDDEALEAEISRSKLINLFEATLVEGVRQGASDVHIYPNANKKVEIHFRVDGRLQHWHTEEKVHPEALLAVIKDNAMNVDRFERDAAQDGFIQRKIDDALIRFRVSVLPIANASQEIRSESIVIRILDDRKVITDLSKLGLLEGALDRFKKAIRQPNGMVIMTGPTGSGKSTTLVAALHHVVNPAVNALTVEDPVEYIIEGVRQIKLNHKLTLDGALRSILRHDPDIVMVGEMRDRQTAELAIKLANTGHLTFSTLHTNDAPSAISRLYKMGIEPFLIAYAINLVVAQRLIRTLCPQCKIEDNDPDNVLLQQLGFSNEEIDKHTFYKQGTNPNCSHCGGTGYSGRRAISEALYFTRKIRHMIVEAEGMIDEQDIREEARKDGLLTLQDSAREIVKMGQTDVQEMIRVVASEGTN